MDSRFSEQSNQPFLSQICWNPHQLQDVFPQNLFHMFCWIDKAQFQFYILKQHLNFVPQPICVPQPI